MTMVLLFMITEAFCLFRVKKMNLFKNFFGTKRKADNSLNGSNYKFALGGSTSGKAVTERSAMQMTAVYACVRILSESIASLPVHLYQYQEKGSKNKALEHPLYKIIHNEPNPEMTSFVFRETLMGHLLLWGNAYAQIIRDGRGRVVSLYPLLPNKMLVNRNDQGILYYQYEKDGQTFLLRNYEVLHIPGLGFDGLIGY